MDTTFDKIGDYNHIIGDITIKGSTPNFSATVNLVLNFHIGNDTTMDFLLPLQILLYPE